VTEGSEAFSLYLIINMKILNRVRGFVLVIILVQFIFSSCGSNKRLVYFNQQSDTSFRLVSKNFEPLIQKGDLLNIAVNSLDPQSSLIFNSQNALGTVGLNASSNPSILPGSMVDNNGNIYMPKLGKVLAEGKTKFQLAEELQERLLPYLKEPVVNIRYMNFRVTVLGEVNRPGTITIPNDKVTLLEALGFAGDLTPFGKRENVVLMREVNGQQEIRHINLSDNSIFTSPYFYLQSNDVVYVEPNNARNYTGTRTQVLLPSVLAGLSFLIIIIDRVVN
jgi:polysaccharide biosynthesis/export protein